MQIGQLLDKIPLWATFIITVFIIILSLKIGILLGDRKRKKSEGEKEGPVGSVVGAMLGLLAFIMAFTFGMTAERFQARRALLLDEVNAISTAYLRTDMLPELQRNEVKKLFREYVDIRANIAAKPDQLAQAIERSEKIQDIIWSHAMSFARERMDSDMPPLLLQSLNEVFDLHTSRVTVGLQYRTPWVIWLVLYFLSIFTMIAVGYQFGIAGGSISMQVNVLLALCFSLVILLIADLDRASQGLLRVSQQPMVELQQKINKTSP